MAGIIPYGRWGRRRQGGATIGPVSLVIIHHWYRPHIGRNASQASEAEALRGVEHYHSVENGWGGGTGYQFHAFGSGRKWEGRGWRRSGAHTVGKNGTSVAIALPIDGDAHEPTGAQTEAVAEIIRIGLAQGHIRAGYRVRGHRAYSSKSCPGAEVTPVWLARLEGLDTQPDPEPDPEDDMCIKEIWVGPDPERTDDDSEHVWQIQRDMSAPESYLGYYTRLTPDEAKHARDLVSRRSDYIEAEAKAARSWFRDARLYRK